MIDTHCHIDMYDKPESICNTSEKNRIITIGMTNLPSHFNIGFQHIQHYKYIRLALGFHPLLIKDNIHEISLFKRLIDKTTYIGEIGLDFSKEGVESKTVQIETFDKLLLSIKSKNKILSLHSRNAEQEVLNMLVKHNIKNAIFHWYSGQLNILDKIVSAGYLFSINPKMITNKSGQKIISKIPLDRILTETDGPYTMINRTQTVPNDVKSVLDYLSTIHNKTFNEMDKIINDNFKLLINRIVKL